MIELKLGVRARDKITGFEGIVVSKVSYLTGCDQWCLTPPVDKDLKVRDGHYFDGARLEVLTVAIKPEDVQQPRDPGGPNRDAPSR